MARNSKPQTETPLTEATTYVLLCLAGQPNHGYGIIKSVSALSNGRIWFTAGTLYGVLKRLLELGWIERQDDPEGVREESGRPRKVYELTEIGKRILKAEADRLEQLARAARTCFIRGSITMETSIAMTQRAYRLLVHMLPGASQDELGADIEDAFALIVREAAREKGPRFLHTLWREFSGLILCLVSEYTHLLEAAIRTSSTRFGTHLLTADAYKIAFCYGIARGLYFVSPGHVMTKYLLAGMLCGLWLSSGRRARTVTFTLGSVLVFVCGSTYLTMVLPALGVGLHLGETAYVTLFQLGEPLIFGMLSGLFLAATRMDQRSSLRGSADGFSGYALGLLVSFVLTMLFWGGIQAIDSYRPGNTGIPSAWVFQLGNVAIWVGFPTLAAIIGARLQVRSGRRYAASFPLLT